MSLTMQGQTPFLGTYLKQGVFMAELTKKQASTAKGTARKKLAPAKAPGTSNKKASDEMVGSVAPAFSMPATLIGKVSTASLKGKPFVLYFYPKDDTSGCTAEACGFRDALPAFADLDVAVIGVSKDSLASHEKFSRKYDLTFPLASDEGGAVCNSFGTWVQKSMYGRTYMGIERSTFLVDGKGVIRAVWRKVSVTGHIEEVRKALESL